MHREKKKWEDNLADVLVSDLKWSRPSALNAAGTLTGIDGKETEYIPYYAAALELKKRLEKKGEIPANDSLIKAQKKDDFPSRKKTEKMIAEISNSLRHPTKLSETQRIREHWEIASYFLKINDHLQGKREELLAVGGEELISSDEEIEEEVVSEEEE